MALCALAACGSPPARVSDPIEELRQLAAVSRPGPGRLTGFAFAPAASSVRSGGPSLPFPNADVIARAALLQRQTFDDPSPANLHAMGVAYLLLGETQKAIQLLQDATAHRRDPVWLNDLSAAYLVLAGQGQVELLIPALDAAVEARQRAGNNPEPRFNLAAAVEQLKLEDAARSLWSDYLALDASGPWREEVVAKRRALAASAMRRADESDIAAAVSRLSLEAIPSSALSWVGDPAAVVESVERTLLLRWAEATLADDRAAAAQPLAVAHRVLTSLAPVVGDRDLLETATAYRDATPIRARVLAAAHSAYVAGIVAIERDDLGVAVRELDKATTLYGHDGVPIRRWVQLQLGTIEYSRQALIDCRTRLERLLSDGRTRQSPLLRARALRLLGLVDVSQRNFAEARSRFEDAITIARDRRDHLLHGRAANHLADLLSTMGRRDEAWSWRVVALEAAARGNAVLRNSVYGSTGHAAFLDGSPRAASIFLEAQVNLNLETPAARVVLLTRYADALVQQGRVEAADRALNEANATLGHLGSDPRVTTLRSLVALAEAAAMAASGNDQGAIARLGEGLAGLADRIPSRAARLRIARADRWAMANDGAAAGRDVQAAIELLERASSGSIREALDAAGIRELLRVSSVITREFARRGNHRAALAHLQQLRTALHGESSDADLQMPARTAVLHLATFDDAIGLWVEQNGAVEFHQVARADVIRAKNRLDLAVLFGRQREALDRSLAELGSLLLTPLTTRLRGVDRLIVIADSELAALPVGSFRVGGKYLFEHMLVQLSPTVLSPDRAAGLARSRTVGVIADPATTQSSILPRLPEARAEAETIAGLYPASQLLVGSMATAARVTMVLQASDIVHWAGHAFVDERDGRRSYLVLSGDGSAVDRLTSDEISKLRLRPGSLIILAACRSMDAPYRALRTDSLTTGFLRGGAAAVIGAAWEIPDRESRAFFEQFHRTLADGVAVDEALRTTQRAFAARGGAESTVALASAFYSRMLPSKSPMEARNDR